MNLYPIFDTNRVQSPIRPSHINSNSFLSKPHLKDYKEFKFKEILQIHRIELKNDELTHLILKEDEKLISVNKYPNDIFLTGFCFWFDNNFRLKGKSREGLATYFNKIRKDEKVMQFANNLSDKACKIPFDEKYLRLLCKFFDYPIPEEQFHQAFYDSISETSSSYMQILYSTYIRICCFYVLQRITDCYLLKDKLIIQECSKKYDNLVKYLEDFNCKSFYDDEYKIILNLMCEAIGITVKLITINKPHLIFMKESFPTNINKTFQLYKKILKLKFIIISDNDNSAVYRAYRNLVEKIKYCLECKESFDKKLKSNLKNVCFDCLKTNYCSINKEKLVKDDFFESTCKHRYCKNCLIYLFNSNQNKTQFNCHFPECKYSISYSQIETFLKNKKNLDEKQNGDLADFQCPNCQKHAIISKNKNNDYVFCCKVCNKSSCLDHKCLIEKCFCYCDKCKSKYSSTFQEVGDFAHIELLECLECKTLICKTCKESLKNYDDFCSCKCCMCFNLKLMEKENNEVNVRCRDCVNICNICFSSLKKTQINFCKKCRMSVCRVCLNEIVCDEKYQYFLKKEFCIFCEKTKKK